MNRTIEIHNLELNPYSTFIVPEDFDIEFDLLDVLNHIIALPKNERTVDTSDSKKMYLDSFVHREEDYKILLKFCTLKYHNSRENVDVITFVEKGRLKGDNDGDKEMNHLCIKFSHTDSGKILFEKNFNGSGITSIKNYLNDFIKKYSRLHYDNLRYKLDIFPEISEDFMAEVQNLDKIKLATFSIDKRFMTTDEFEDLAGRNDVNDTVDLVIKPTDAGFGLRAKTIKEYYKKLVRNEIIEKIKISGTSEDKAITINTEKAKKKLVAEVVVNPFGEVHTEDIFTKLVHISDTI